MMWSCPQCDSENEMENLVCSECQAARPYTPLQYLIINSADEYYKHLETHNSGTNEVKILNRSSEQVEAPESTTAYPIFHTRWILELGGSLYDLDGFVIKETRNENPAVWNSDSFKIIEYDNEQRRLIIRILRNEKNFSQIPCNNIRIVSDLKFLVKNVEKWARDNGNDLKLPETVYTAFQNAGGDQKPEIQHILKHPVQYVWGPPGTGKTRHALSDAVKQVVLAGGQAAVFAPTNSAVENALEPIIEKGVCQQDQILRLGTPSHSFASKYPECCEEVGVQKRITEISQQIGKWEKDLKFREGAETAIQALSALDSLFCEFDGLKGAVLEKEMNRAQHEKELDKLRAQSDELVRDTVEINARIEHEKQFLSAVQRDIKKYYGSGIRSFISGFQTRPERDVLLGKEKSCKGELERLCGQHLLLEKRIDKLTVEKAAQDRLIARYAQERTQAAKEVEQKVSQIRQRQTSRPVINEVLAELTAEGIGEVKRNLDEIRKNAEDVLASIDPVEWKEKITQAQAEKEKLGKSTQEVLDQKKVIGMTLDKYISLFMDTPLKCAHKFVDEAGFVPLAKALCLFNDSRIPITFIGDHKQISPICENTNRELSAPTLKLWSMPAMYSPWLLGAADPFERINEQLPEEMAELYPNMYILNKTYRFGANLAELLDRFVYQCGLTSEAKHPLNIRVVDISATEAPEAWVNVEEAHSAVQHFFSVDEACSAAIITPYLNQVRTIKNVLPYQQRDGVLTVHKAQGREWDHVVFSVVDDGGTGRGPFLANFLNRQADADKLLNTALSRAKKELVLICNVNYWLNRADANRQLISQLILLAREQDGGE